MALKHCLLEEELGSTGEIRWVLTGPQGEIAAFSHWQDGIRGRLSYESRRAYSTAVAQFVDYLYESRAFEEVRLSPKRARELLEGYRALLERGPNSRSRWLRRIAEGLPHKFPLQPKSANVKLTAVAAFLEECEDLFEEVVEKFANRGDSIPPSPYPVILGDLSRLPVRHHREIARVRQNSMLGGVIRNAAKTLRKRRRWLVKEPAAAPWDDSRREFPLDQLGSLIEAAQSCRDKALYTLLACGGLRTHEALQLRISSLDFETQTVDLYDFIYGSTPPRDELRRKGRSARYVYFWPGYETLFFHYIKRYLETERRHLVRDPHSYVFVKIRPGADRGQPLFTATDKARDDAFKRAQRRAGLLSLNGRSYGLHSLRHSYGVYMANHCPRDDGGVGLNLAIVQRLMGHAQLSATMHYARHEKHKIDAVLNAGRRLYGHAGLDPEMFRDALAESHLREARRILDNDS